MHCQASAVLQHPEERCSSVMQQRMMKKMTALL
jgi:hypothetical protein